MSDGLHSPIGGWGLYIATPVCEAALGTAMGIATMAATESLKEPISGAVEAEVAVAVKKVVPKPILPRIVPPKPKMRLADAVGKQTIPFGTRIAGWKPVRSFNLNRLLATDAERLAFAWLCENDIPFNFETTLLAGRPELNFAEVPFLLQEELSQSHYQAMRFYEQASGKTIMDGEFLKRCGYEVIDLSAVAVLSNVDKVLGLALEFD